MTEEVTPRFTRAEFRDIGHNVQIREVYEDGKLHAVEYVHQCTPRVRRTEGDYIPLAPPHGWDLNGWQCVSEKPLTLAPSLLCRSCGHHGFIKDGAWVPA